MASRRPQVTPASLGVSVLIPPGTVADTVTVTLRCAEYEPYHPDGVKKTRRPNWRRKPHPDYAVVLPLDPAKLAEGVRIPELTGVVIAGKLGESSTPKPGTRALSVFVVNRRGAGERGRRDEQMLFQVSLEVRYEAGFLARPALRRGSELDDKIASLQYRHVCEYAVGHGVAVEVSAAIGGKVTTVTTTWRHAGDARLVSLSWRRCRCGTGAGVVRGSTDRGGFAGRPARSLAAELVAPAARTSDRSTGPAARRTPCTTPPPGHTPGPDRGRCVT